jgi:hypothetical protein
VPVSGADADRRTDGEPGGTVGDVDGGVTRRLTQRCWIAASVLLTLSGCLLLVVLLRSWGTVSAVLALVAVAAVIPGGLLAGRARGWSMVRAASLPLPGGRAAVVGPPRPLSPIRTGAPVRRRLGASVVPILADGAEQPGGGALIVHARTDGLSLADGDRVSCFTIRRGGVDAFVRASANESERPVTGRFVLLRVSDDAVFIATTRLTDTW